MASLEEGNNVTSSVCVNRLASGIHLFKITGYSVIKKTCTDCIQSSSFCIGGLEWAIRYHPFAPTFDYSTTGFHDDRFYMSLYLVLLSDPNRTDVDAVYFEFSLLDEKGSPSERSILSGVFAQRMSSCTLNGNANVGIESGFKRFITHAELEAHYVRDDCFTIQCSVSNVLECTVAAVLSSSLKLQHHFGNLLKNEVGTDIKFDVRGKIFSAHRCVLAARSPVFHAQFFGSLSRQSHEIEPIKIEDADPVAFEAMLQFIYTDSVQKIDLTSSSRPSERSDSVKLAQHLLVLADRFLLVELCKLTEERLSEEISADTIMTTFALAEQYNLRGLKTACIKSGCMPLNLISKLFI